MRKIIVGLILISFMLLLVPFNVSASSTYYELFDGPEDVPTSTPVSSDDEGNWYSWKRYGGHGMVQDAEFQSGSQGGQFLLTVDDVECHINFTKNKQIEEFKFRAKNKAGVWSTGILEYWLVDSSGNKIINLQQDYNYFYNGQTAEELGYFQSIDWHYFNFTIVDDDTVNISITRISDGYVAVYKDVDTILGRSTSTIAGMHVWVNTADAGEIVYIDNMEVTFSDNPVSQGDKLIFRLTDCEWGITYDLIPVGTSGPYDSYSYIDNLSVYVDDVSYDFEYYQGGYGNFVTIDVSGLSAGAHDFRFLNGYTGSLLGRSYNYPESGWNNFNYKQNYTVFIIPNDPTEIHLIPSTDVDSQNLTEEQLDYYETVHGVRQYVEFYNQEVDGFYSVTDEPIIVYNITTDWLEPGQSLLQFDIVYGETQVLHSSLLDLSRGNMSGIRTLWEWLFPYKGYYRIKVYSFDNSTASIVNHRYTSDILYVDAVPVSQQEFEDENIPVVGGLTRNELYFLIGFFIWCLFLAIGGWIASKLTSKDIQKIFFSGFATFGVVFNGYFSFWGVWICFTLVLLFIGIIILTIYKR